MNRTGLKWWQLAILVNALIAFMVLMGVNTIDINCLFVVLYAALSFYLAAKVYRSNIEKFDNAA